jgi:putative FmdB family regulatory protein
MDFMVYDYKCVRCGKIEEQYHGMKETPEFFCPDCDSPMERIFTINRTGFIIRGEAPSKVIKEQRYRQKHNADLGLRQVERYGTGPKPVPNVGGEEVGSWKEAAKLAKDKGLNTASYEPLIQKEKTISKVSRVDDKVWKKAKEAKGSVQV